MEQSDNGAAIDFVTMGMFIIDDIYPAPSDPDQTPKTNIIGGGGTYSAIGARLFSPPPSSHTIGWIVDGGTDFPPDLRQIIASWETAVLLRNRNAPTTRGWNGYGENQHRAFKYLTEKKRIEASDLTPEFMRAKSVHLICHPNRCISTIQSILERRKAELRDDEPKQVFIWEPVPDLCVTEEFDNTLKALHFVDVISPNHEELASLFSFKHPDTIDRKALESQAQTLLDHGIGSNGKGAVVVRAGKEGCYIRSHAVSQWLPAYFTDPGRVVDPTGGGNGFLGGFAVGYVRTGGDLVEAAWWGSVAASFCIEQVGMPVLQKGSGTAEERWNGARVIDRLTELRHRSAAEPSQRG